jgi:hypothetical protein
MIVEIIPCPQGSLKWHLAIICLDISWPSGQVSYNIGISFSLFAHLARPLRVPCSKAVLISFYAILRLNPFLRDITLDRVS